MRGILKYVVNPWIWWYWIKGAEVFNTLLQIWSFSLAYMNVVPMLRNLFQPLYQDYSFVGRVVAFPIRLGWVVGGSLIQLVITVPVIFAFLIYLILPILPIIQLVRYF